MGPISVKDISNTDTINSLGELLGSKDTSKLDSHQRIALNFLKGNPNISGTKVHRSLGGSFYDFANNRLGLHSDSPDILAHELGHAARLADASKEYKSLLSAAKRVSSINNMVSMPIASLIALNKNMEYESKKHALRNLALVSAGISSPNLMEELAASYHAVKNSDSPLRTTIGMAPGIVSHSLNDLSAPLTYAAVNKLVKE